MQQHARQQRGACLALLFEGVGLGDGGLEVVLEEGEVDARAHGEDVQQVEQGPHKVVVAA